ncbi:MAG: MFS transporter [Bauldia sp.]
MNDIDRRGAGAQPAPRTIGADAILRARIGISIGFLLGGMTLAIWAVHIPLVARRLDLQPGILGLALLCIGTGAFLPQPLVGVLVSRHGSRRISRILLPAFVAMMPLTVTAPTRPLLFLACFLLGAAGGSYNVAINTQGAELEAARGKPTMSWFHGCWSLGGLVGATLGGLVIGAGYGSGIGAAAIAALMIAGGVPASALLFASPPRPRPAKAPGGRRFAMPAAPLLGLLAIAVLGEYVESSVNNWSTLYLTTVRGLDPAHAATGLAVFSLGMAICRLGGGPVVSRLGERTVVLGGGLLVALGIAVVVLVPWPSLSPFGYALVALGAANGVPVLIGASSRIPGIDTGVAVATVITFITIGYLSSPPVVGFVSQAFGATVGMAVLGAAGLTIATIAALRQWQPAPGR